MDLLKSILSAVIDPAKRYGQYVGGAGYEGYRAAKSALGDKNAYVNQNTGKVIQNPFLNEEELSAASERPIETGIRRTAGAASYLVPFGKGASLLSKVLLPGATAAGLTKFSEDKSTPRDVLISAGLGAGGAGLLNGAIVGGSKLLNKLGGGLEKAGNSVLTGQYNLSKGDRIKMNLNDTVGKLADYGIKNINQVGPAADKVTGANGAITKLTRDAVSKAQPIDTADLYGMAESLVDDPSIAVGQDKKLLQFFKKGIQSLADPNTPTPELGGNPLNALDFIKTLEKQAAGIKGVTAQDEAIKKAYSMFADELKDRLYQQSGADKIATSLAQQPQYLQELAKVSPKLAEAASKVKNLGELRSLSAPFVRGSQAAQKSMQAEGGKLFGMTDILTGGAGVASLGPGGIGILAAKKALESNPGRVITSNILDKTGNAAQKISSIKNPLLNQILNQFAIRAGSSISDMNQNFPENGVDFTTDITNITQNKKNAPQDIVHNGVNNLQYSSVPGEVMGVQDEFIPSEDGQYQTNNRTGEVISMDGQWKFDPQQDDWVPNEQMATLAKQGITQQEDPFTDNQRMVEQAMMNALASGDLDSFTKLAAVNESFVDLAMKRQKLSELQNPQLKEKGKEKTLSASAQQMIGKANAGLKALGRLEDSLNKDSTVLLKSSIPGAPGARTYEADTSSLIDAIGGLRTGATVSKDQLAYYRNMLPKIGDSKKTIKDKLQALREELQGYANVQPDTETPKSVDNEMLMQMLSTGGYI